MQNAVWPGDPWSELEQQIFFCGKFNLFLEELLLKSRVMSGNAL